MGTARGAPPPARFTAEQERFRAEARELHAQAAALEQQRQYKEAEQLLRGALKLRLFVLGAHPDTATTYAYLAWNLTTQGKHALAQPYYEAMLAIRCKALGSNHILTAASYNLLGQNLRAQRKWAQAQREHEKGLAIGVPHEKWTGS
jgi:tetratricopeptide (TPR) repeat protein